MLGFQQAKDNFKDYYRANTELFRRAETAFRVLIRSLLANTPTIETPVVTSRVKDCEECIRKFELKYLKNFGESEYYEIKTYITDLVGVRVACFYETDIPIIQDILTGEFYAKATDKTAQLEADAGAFGYKGIHLDVKLSERRKQLPEYGEIKDFLVEVQIRTKVQDSWSELDHKIAYKKSIPVALLRRIRRLAALFELADSEFVQVKLETERLGQQALSPEEGKDAVNSHGTPPESEAASTPLDAFSFLAVAQPRFDGFNFDPSYVDAFVDSIIEIDPEFTKEEFQKAMDTCFAKVGNFVSYLNAEQKGSPGPYTIIRHILYLFDPVRFQSALWNKQRGNFEEWLKSAH